MKQCTSLANEGFDISLIVADGKGNIIKNGINIYDVGASNNRLFRILTAPKRVYKKAISINADLYHLHDPELLPIGIKLKRFGKKVIFDSHEDVPSQMLDNTYLYFPIRWGISKLIKYFERYACAKFDAIITATPFIRDKFIPINSNAIDINNFPFISKSIVKRKNGRSRSVCYAGAIGKKRGIIEMILALKHVHGSIRLNLAGGFYEKDIKNISMKLAEWDLVDFHGYVNNVKINMIYTNSFAGLVLFHPAANHINAQPNKLFEYMSVGIPVIASNFPLWCNIIEDNNCGICVDPLQPKAIAEAINYLFDNPLKAEEMGKNGQKLIKGKYNWDNEQVKLLNLYDSIS